MSDDSIKIRRLNDGFRTGDATVPGMIVITRGIDDLVSGDPNDPCALFDKVQTYKSFTPDNDPYGEHDFGSFEFKGEICFWKIDVYDPSLEIAALDPTDPQLSKRVLTIMLASEY